MAGIDPDGALDDAAGLPRIFRMAVSAGGRIYLSGHLDPRRRGDRAHRARGGDERRPPGRRSAHPRPNGRATRWSSSPAGPRPAATCPTVRGRAPAGAGDHRLVGAVRRTRRARGDRRRAALRRARSPPRPPAGWPATPACGRIFTDPDGLPLDVGREQRTATAAIRRAIETPRRALRLHRLHRPAPPGATSTTSCTGPTAARPRARTGRCSANGTTPPSTKAGFRIARDPGTAVWHTYRPDGTEIHIRATSRPATQDCAHHPDARGAGPGDQPAGATGHQQVKGCRSPSRRAAAPGPAVNESGTWRTNVVPSSNCACRNQISLTSRVARLDPDQLGRATVDRHVELRPDRPHDRRRRTWSGGMTSSGSGRCTVSVCCS